MASDGARSAAWIGVAGAALAAIIGGVFTLVAARGDSGSGSAPTSTTSVAPSAAVPTDHPAASPTGSDSPGATPGIYHRDPLYLPITGGLHQADLDASTDDPQWGTEPNNFSGTWDIATEGNGTGSVLTLGTLGLVTDQTPTYEYCLHAPGYATQEFTLSRLRHAKGLCVKTTTEGRYSVLSIKSVSTTGLTFEVTTYANATD